MKIDYLDEKLDKSKQPQEKVNQLEQELSEKKEFLEVIANKVSSLVENIKKS